MNFSTLKRRPAIEATPPASDATTQAPLPAGDHAPPGILTPATTPPASFEALRTILKPRPSGAAPARPRKPKVHWEDGTVNRPADLLGRFAKLLPARWTGPDPATAGRPGSIASIVASHVARERAIALEREVKAAAAVAAREARHAATLRIAEARAKTLGQQALQATISRAVPTVTCDRLWKEAVAAAGTAIAAEKALVAIQRPTFARAVDAPTPDEDA